MGHLSIFTTIINNIVWKYLIIYTDVFKNKKLYLNEIQNVNNLKINIIDELLEYIEGVSMV